MFKRIWRFFVSEECSICLEKLTIGENYFSIECGHNYHSSCLIKTNGKCPICVSKTSELDDIFLKELEEMKYEDSVNFAIEKINKFYEMDEKPEHYKIRDMIDKVFTAFLGGDPNLIRTIAENYYSAKLDLLHPEIVIEWELYFAFKRLATELEIPSF